MTQHLGAILETRFSSREPLQRQGPGKERRRETDSPPVSQLGFHSLLHGYIYCLYATDPEIYSIYFRLTPFVCEYNSMFQRFSHLKLKLLFLHMC